VTGDCKNGEGTYLYSNAKYWGNWKDGKRDGFGTLTRDDGSSMYKGNWSNDKKNGYGSFYWSNGDRYEGNWVDDNRSGQCTFYWKDGDRFVGQFIDDNMTENGITTRKIIPKLCISGDCYNGYGKFGFTNAVYEGYFKNGKREGKGKTIAWDGGIYEGEYVIGLPNGKGKYTFTDGSVYEGNWVNGERTGKGIFIWGKGKWEGESYEGDFINGFRTGFGKYTKKDGTIQEGKFLNNVFQGVELASSNTKVNSQTSNNSTTTNSPATDRFGNKVSNNSTNVSNSTNSSKSSNTVIGFPCNVKSLNIDDIVSCYSCSGTGQETRQSSSVCPNCESWNSEYKRKVACHVCKDTRKNPNIKTWKETCWRCKGSGRNYEQEKRNRDFGGYAQRIVKGTYNGTYGNIEYKSISIEHRGGFTETEFDYSKWSTGCSCLGSEWSLPNRGELVLIMNDLQSNGVIGDDGQYATNETEIKGDWNNNYIWVIKFGQSILQDTKVLSSNMSINDDYWHGLRSKVICIKRK
jgi:hypothetical protein